MAGTTLFVVVIRKLDGAACVIETITRVWTVLGRIEGTLQPVENYYMKGVQYLQFDWRCLHNNGPLLLSKPKN